MLAASHRRASVRLARPARRAPISAARNVAYDVPRGRHNVLQRQKVREPPRLVVVQQAAIGVAAGVVRGARRPDLRPRQQLGPRPQMHGDEPPAGRFDDAVAAAARARRGPRSSRRSSWSSQHRMDASRLDAVARLVRRTVASLMFRHSTSIAHSTTTPTASTAGTSHGIAEHVLQRRVGVPERRPAHHHRQRRQAQERAVRNHVVAAQHQLQRRRRPAPRTARGRR